MELIASHVLSIFCMLFSCLFACFLPSIISISVDPQTKKHRFISALKTYCNCVSGGVFAGAFFTQFYPHVTKEFSELIPNSRWDVPLQAGPSIVFLGFILTGLLESLVDFLIHKCKRPKSSANGRVTGNGQELRNLQTNDPETDHHYSPVRLEEEDEHDDTDPLTLPKNDDLVLPDPNSKSKFSLRNVLPRKPNTPRNNDSHSHDHHSHNHHHHHHHDLSLGDYHGFSRFIVLFASLGVHSVFEGLSLGLLKDTTVLWNMFISIVVHEVLMAVALGVSLSKQNTGKLTKFGFSLFFATIIPAGQVVGLIVQQMPDSAGSKIVMSVLQLVSAGTFIHVMFMGILPQEMHEHFGIVKAFWICFGFALIPLTSVATWTSEAASGHH